MNCSTVSSVLVRRSLTLLEPVENTLDPLTAELAERAETVLGYSVLKARVDLKSHLIDSAQKPVTFVQTLHDLDIQPFSDDSVAEYKAQRRQEVLGFLGSRPTLRTMLGLFSWAFAIVCFVMTLVMASRIWPSSAIAFGVATSILCFLTAWVISYNTRNGRWSWKAITIEKYRQPVPEYVLNKAIAIKEAFPQAMLFVEQLVYTKPQRATRYGDPFLCVEYDKQSYYIEVWDEPRFEARL